MHRFSAFVEKGPVKEGNAAEATDTERKAVIAD